MMTGGLLEFVQRDAMVFETQVAIAMGSMGCTREEAIEAVKALSDALAPLICVPENPYTLH
jgi:hypothetical protein